MQTMCSACPVLAICTTLHALVFVACGPTRGAEQDVRRPTLLWRVEDRIAQSVVDIPSGGQLHGNEDSDFLVMLIAADSGGIQSISLGGESSQTCGSDTIGQTVDALFAGQTQTLPADEGEVLTKISLYQEIMPNSVCEAGLVWQKESIHLTGTGTNYVDGTTMGNLLIEFAP
jgi:hypothetical protein